jgi:hypothetical protein
MQADWYTTKLGTGGDLSGIIDKRVNSMKEEANKILWLNQKATIARPLYG